MVNKRKFPTERIIHVSERLKVCGHPVRLQILVLIQEKDSCVFEIWQCLEMPQSVISQHLSVLKRKKVVESKKVGTRRVYSIVDDFISLLVGELAGISSPLVPLAAGKTKKEALISNTA